MLLCKEVDHANPLKPCPPRIWQLTVTELEHRIRVRAYEIYEERRRQEGHALNDWLEAKAEVLGVVAKAKAA
jgi:hypothetical protein